MNQYVYNKYGSREPQRSSRERTSRDTTRDYAFEPAPEPIKNTFSVYSDNDYSDNHIHTGISPIVFIQNISNPEEGYPKLTRLHDLKREQTQNHAVKPFGARVATNQIISTLNYWINKGVKFDVIMIGALVENQFILPLLLNLPMHKLCSKPGFLFVWANTQKILELNKLLLNENFNKKFRRSEELIFLPVNKDSPYFPGEDPNVSLFQKQQWHCWMCITGTVRRSTDNHLIHCNVDTDLQIESKESLVNNAVPNSLYKVAENFSNSNRRLHIVPSKIGYDLPIRLRPGWVIMGPDVLLDNFSPEAYEEELVGKSFIRHKNGGVQYLVPQGDEVEELRPKSA